MTEIETKPVKSPYYIYEDEAVEIKDRLSEILNDDAQEKIKGHLKKMMDEVTYDLWGAVDDFLECDTEMNFRSKVNQRAVKLVESLLVGDKETLAHFNLALKESKTENRIKGEYDPRGIRRKLVEDHQDFLQNQTIKDLEAEVKRLNQAIKYYR